MHNLRVMLGIPTAGVRFLAGADFEILQLYSTLANKTLQYLSC